MTRLVLIIPLGVDNNIFNWGVYIIRNYLKASLPRVDVCIWDLNNDDDIHAIFHKNSLVIEKLKPLFLRFDDCLLYPYIGNILNQKLFNILCYCGGNFFKLEGILNSIPNNFSKTDFTILTDLKIEFEACVENSLMNYSKGAERLIFGLSVYDDTVFGSLYISSLIKRIIKTAPIILGGEAITISKGIELVKKIRWIDGAVVGYGEEVMKRVIVGYEDGIHPRELNIQRLVNITSLGNPQSISTGPLIPPFYNADNENPSIKLVEIDKNYRLHILPQRGCEWGRCTFCKHIDNNYHFYMDNSNIRKEIIIKIEMIKRHDNELKTIDVVIDSESNVPSSIIPIFEALRVADDKIHFNLFWWMRIAQISKELLLYLFSFNGSNIRFHLECGIESLNPTNLRNMCKGTNPLMVLEKLKAIHDVGGQVGGNYFIFFPLENIDNVKAEMYFLSKSLHLLCSKKTSISCTVTYIPNDRDIIFHNQKKYRVVIEPTIDFFLKNIFNLDLPWNMNAVKYSLNYPISAKNLIVKLYFKLFNDFYDYRFRRALYEYYFSRNSFIGKMGLLLEVSFMKLARILRYRMWLGLQLFLKNKSYYQRAKIIEWWAKVEHAKMLGRDESIPIKNKDRHHIDDYQIPEFFLKNKILSKRYAEPAYSNWSLNLNPAELDILRYLYWRRSFQNVLAYFKNKYSKDEVMEIINRHIHLGSIIRYKNILLSIFNDPDYFGIGKNEQFS